MTFELDVRHRQSPALDLLDHKLVDLADGRIAKLMWFMPPQEGKSQKVSRRYPTWRLYDDPSLRIVILSYDLQRARRWGREIKRDIEQHPVLRTRIRLRADSKAAGSWLTDEGGGIYCAGIRGGITGEPADEVIVDDPIKGMREASSIVFRDDAWDTWEGSITPRLSGRARVVIVQTRWHHDDLSGRILDREPEGWEVVAIPAIAEAGDPLGRQPGEEFKSVRDREPGYFTQLRKTRSPAVFEPVYQQHPGKTQGTLFVRDRARLWHHGAGMDRFVIDSHGGDVDLRDCYRFITIDLAASTKTSADFTVGAAWAIAPAGDLILLDLVRDRVAEAQHFELIAPLRSRWLQPGDVVYVEKGFIGTTFVYEAGRQGVPIAPLEADADKTTRALPAADRWFSGRLWLPPDAPWLVDYLDELAQFPTGTNDDQVDVTAYAARVAAAHWVQATDPLPPTKSPDLDLMNVPY
jgi:predicted phage terminase large subunit-like protein